MSHSSKFIFLAGLVLGLSACDGDSSPSSTPTAQAPAVQVADSTNNGSSNASSNSSSEVSSTTSSTNSSSVSVETGVVVSDGEGEVNGSITVVTESNGESVTEVTEISGSGTTEVTVVNGETSGSGVVIVDTGSQGDPEIVDEGSDNSDDEGVNDPEIVDEGSDNSDDEGANDPEIVDEGSDNSDDEGVNDPEIVDEGSDNSGDEGANDPEIVDEGSDNSDDEGANDPEIVDEGSDNSDDEGVNDPEIVDEGSTPDDSQVPDNTLPPRSSVLVVSAIDSDSQAFEAFNNRFVTFDYSSSNFDGDFEVGDIVEILSSPEGTTIEVVELSVVNDQDVTFVQGGSLRVVSTDANGAPLMSMNFSDVVFTLNPDAEYGGGTFDDFSEVIMLENEALSSGATIDIARTEVRYTKTEGFVLERFILEFQSEQVTIDNIALIDNPANNELAIVTANGENYILEKGTRLRNSPFVSRDQLTLETLEVGVFVRLSYWDRNLQERVLSSLQTVCEFGLDSSFNCNSAP